MRALAELVEYRAFNPMDFLKIFRPFIGQNESFMREPDLAGIYPGCTLTIPETGSSQCSA